MKKNLKIILLFMILIIVIIIICISHNVDKSNLNTYDDIKTSKYYKKVLNGTENIITLNKNYTINEYLKGNDEFLDNKIEAKYIVIGYASVDLDNDNIEEIIFKMSFDNEYYYAVLHYENKNVYGFSYINGNSFKYLNTEGVFVFENKDIDETYNKVYFEENRIMFNEIASYHYNMGNKFYKVNGSEVSKDKYDAFKKEFNSVSKVKFITYIKK